MGTRNFNHVKQEANRCAILLKVYGDGDIGLVVWRRPRVRSEIQSSIVFLVCPSDTFNFEQKH